jgi:hypothetical protein
MEGREGAWIIVQDGRKCAVTTCMMDSVWKSAKYSLISTVNSHSVLLLVAPSSPAASWRTKKGWVSDSGSHYVWSWFDSVAVGRISRLPYLAELFWFCSYLAEVLWFCSWWLDRLVTWLKFYVSIAGGWISADYLTEAVWFSSRRVDKLVTWLKLYVR